MDAELYRTIIEVVDDRIREIKVTREDFDALKQVVMQLVQSQNELAQAQKRTEMRVEELAQAQLRTELSLQKLEKTVSTIGSRWGIFVEETFRNAMKEIIESEFQAKAEQIWLKDYQVDLLIRDGRHILIEITSSTKREDINNLLKASEIYREQKGVEPRLMLMTAYISPRLMRVAQENGIEILSHE